MAKRMPAIENARTFILQAICSGEFASGEPLPSMRALASRANVSLQSMWKTIDLLKKEGLLAGAPGHRIIIAAGTETACFDALSSAQQPAAEEKALWRITRKAIERDILNRVFMPDRHLPSRKELQNRYGVSYPTLRKALAELCNEGVLSSDRRGFKAKVFAARSKNLELAILTQYEPDGILPTNKQDRRLLETICFQSGIKPRHILHRSNPGGFPHVQDAVTGEPYRLDERPKVLGYLAFVTEWSEDWKEILARVGMLHRPLAIHDSIGGWRLPSMASRAARVRIFRAELNPNAGAVMARYLLELGHRNVAYFSPFHGSLWSRQRVSRMAATFTQAGYSDGVKQFTIDRGQYDTDYIADIAAPESIEQINRMRAQLKEHSNRILSHYIRPLISPVNVERAWGQAEMYRSLEPLMKNALADTSVTAWVASNDQAAVLMLDFLRNAGIKIPQQLSIVSFDNSIAAMEADLTSYDFNRSASITGMVAHALGWPMQILGESKLYFDTEGTVVERTTARKI